MQNSLDFLNEKVDDLFHMKKEITEILSLVTNLQAIIMAKDKQIESLQSRIEDLGQYTRKENIIICGLTTDHRTCAKQCTPNYSKIIYANASDVEHKCLESKVVGYLNNKLELGIKSPDISARHPPKNNLHGKPDNIIIKFVICIVIVFFMHTKPLSTVIDSHSITHNSFADDIQDVCFFLEDIPANSL